MRTVEPHILEDKMDEAVTHYINTHQSTEPVHIDTNGMPISVQDDGGGRVTVMHQQGYTTQMCRQVSVSEQVGEGPWSEELLDEGRIAAIVAHLAQNPRASHHHPPPHHKVASVRNEVDTSVILDGTIRFNEQPIDQQDSIVVQLPPMQTLPPLQDMKRCQESDWFTDKNKKDTNMLPNSDSPVLELAGASPAQHKQSKKSLPHKKRISRKLKRNNGNSTPQQKSHDDTVPSYVDQQDLVVINCNEPPEQILPDNFVAVHQPEHHLHHEMRPILICQICGEFYGEEQLKFFHHLKQHYEPHGTIIIENPVSDLVMDKMTNTCIVDNVVTLPDSIVELSLENTVPKTMYQPIDKHILYTTADKTLYNNKVQYSMASIDKEPGNESEKSDLYLTETLDKLDLYNCGKCSKTFRKQKQCEAHMREAHINPKLEEMGEFSEPEDLMAGIQVCVAEYALSPLPLAAHDAHAHPHTHTHAHAHANTHAQHDAHRNWYPRISSVTTNGYNVRPHDTQPLKILKEEVLQRIFENEVTTDPSHFSDNIMHDNNVAHHENEVAHHENEVAHHDNEINHHDNDRDHDNHTESHQNDHNHELNHQNHSHHDQNQHLQDSQHGHHDSQHSLHDSQHGHHDSQHSLHDSQHSIHDSQHSLHDSQHSIHDSQNSLHDNQIGHHDNQHSHDNRDIQPENRTQEQPTVVNSLIRRTKEKNGKKEMECTVCGRVFLHRNSLLYHLLSHDRKQHLCRECGNTFYTRAALKVHKRTHSGDKPYKCDECGRDFRQISDLRYHKTSLHSDKKHFKCEFCGKEFARKYSLSIHRKIHTGERNYECHYCTKTFRASSYRLTHMRTHTGDRPYKCEQCEKCFRSAFDLRRHMLVHEKMRLRMEENKNKPKETKKSKTPDVKEEKVETPKPSKKVALASTTRPPTVVKKSPKTKKSPTKKGAPNVTVNKDNEFYKEEVFSRQVDYAKYKDVSEAPKDDNLNPFKQTVYKDERDIATLRPIKVIDDKCYRSDADTKIQVFSHVERSRDYNGSIVSNTQVINDMRHLEREVRNDIDGENVDSSNVFLERLTALYNIPA